jgi:hypothetical protein
LAVGAVLAILSMPLPWLKVGGVVLSAETATGFDLARRFSEGAATGGCLLLFMASVATLAIIVLPYALKGGQARLDRSLTYLLLQVVAVAGLLASALSLLSPEGGSLAPADAPGLWLAIVGVGIGVWGLLETIAEPPPPV